ncbi:MAG TPA: gamma-glutamyltransferase [Gammaproteobacteria bacterium]
MSRRLSVLALLLACATAGAQPLPGAAIATAHPAATAAGHAILAAGGNAFDAAVAVSAVLAVAEPYSSGLGGGGFWLLHRAVDGSEVMLDGREVAPSAAHRDMYLDAAGQPVPGLAVDGPLAAGIPGVPAALDHLARHYGRLPLARSLEPAIRLARDGVAVDAHYGRLASFRLVALQAADDAAEIFLDRDQAPAAGWVLKQPELARTLERLAAEGRDGFYRGPVAAALVDGVRAAGGIWDAADLADYSVVEREPVRFDYRGMRVTAAALPSSGGVVLGQMLNVLSGYPLDELATEDRVHLLVEAMRRAYRDRAAWLGDPDQVDVPQSRLLDPDYAAGLRAAIHPVRATPSALLPGIADPDPGRHTTHYSILDREGNRVAATLSINYPFGSGFVAPGTGVLLNDEMDDFSLQPGVPNVYGLVGNEANAIAPRKRMLSSMTPAFLDDGGRLALLGTPGGSRIITMVLLAALEFAAGADAGRMAALPRFHHQYLPDRIDYEPGAFSAELVAGLEARGHALQAATRTWGNMQVVLWDRGRGRLQAASDPRGSGLAEVR